MAELTLASTTRDESRRRYLVVALVVCVHAVLLYLIQSGFSKVADQLIIPAQVISESVLLQTPAEMAAPTAQPVDALPTPQPPMQTVRAPQKPVVREVAPKLTPTPTPDTSQTPSTVRAEPQQTAAVAQNSIPLTDAADTAAATASKRVDTNPAPPATPALELPSSSASYLNNPKPAYPAMSRRLGEEGKVVVRVFIAADGSAQDVQLGKSSGYDRLDQAALDAVKRWRFVPGKRNGVPEAMWFNVPVNFVLD